MDTKVVVVEARGLEPKDEGGTSDPFVLVGEMNERTGEFCKEKVWKSEYIAKTLTPKWNFTVNIEAEATIRVEVWDYNTGKDEFEGYALIPTNLIGDHWLPLKRRSYKDKVRGEVHVIVTKTKHIAHTPAQTVATPDPAAVSPLIRHTPSSEKEDTPEKYDAPIFQKTEALAEPSQVSPPLVSVSSAPPVELSVPVGATSTSSTTDSEPVASSSTSSVDELEASSQLKPEVPEPPPQPVPGHNGKHIMLSYNWGSQEFVKQLYKELIQAGYVVWMDIEGGMRGGGGIHFI